MDKYYTPEISEFFVGFEYETLYLQDYDTWKKEILEEDDAGYFQSIYSGDAIPTEFRVKYLDKEDIESLGWEFIKQHPGTTSFDFEKEEYSLNFDPEFGSKWNLRIYDGEDQDSEFNYFSGYVKNKSELIKLLKQLQIG